MNKKTPKRTAPKKAVPLKLQDERTRIHRAINWVVSIILIVFAIWSISLNTEGRSLLKQATAIVAETDIKLQTISNDIKVVKELCQTTPIVIPTPTIDVVE